jgi:hypothetical protein
MLERQFPAGIDSDRVKREDAAGAFIDDQAGPYDPNNQAATAAYWKQATITRDCGRPPVSVKRPCSVESNPEPGTIVPILQKSHGAWR